MEIMLMMMLVTKFHLCKPTIQKIPPMTKEGANRGRQKFSHPANPPELPVSSDLW